MYELLHNYEVIGIPCVPWIIYIYIAAVTALVIFYPHRFLILSCFVIASAACMFAGVFSSRIGAKGAIYTTAALVYPGVFFTVYLMIAGGELWLPTLTIGALACFFCDTFALLGGTKFGKHKVAPLVSPNKSVEGCICGAASSLAAGALGYFILLKWFPLPLWLCVITAFIASTMGQIGDLVESLLKRYLGVKDFSNLIPGHGGMFDRADSLLLAIPTAYFFIYAYTLFA